MSEEPAPRVAIVDYGMGNLFSVIHACDQVGLSPVITSEERQIRNADAVVLPGVGAFANAMDTLNDLHIVDSLREVAASGKPLVGICLGMQLLMSESQEFGRHKGLSIIDGTVERLETSVDGSRNLKVPQVGWNQIHPGTDGTSHTLSWEGTPLQGLDDGEYMYFVHSFYVRPSNSAVILSTTQYGHNVFCSSLRMGSVFACQYHPERSGPQGLRIYRTLASMVGASSPD